MTTDAPLKPLLVYVTARDGDEARMLAETVVRERLAACANVTDQVTSFFFWDGQAQSESEAVLVLKTRAGRLAALSDRIKALHSYDCPCVVALEIQGGNDDFLEWIVKETS